MINVLTPNALLLGALLGFAGAVEEIVLRSGMWGSGSGGSTRNRNGFAALRAIVTGLEHSGTTVTSKILFNAPCVIGAWETGFLILKTPAGIRNLDPYFQWHTNMDLKSMYMLKPSDVNALANAKGFPQMFDVLRNRSHIFNNLSDEAYCDKPYQMIDKTPQYIYMKHFERILNETHGAKVPVIVLKKNYESLKESYARHKSKLRRSLYNAVYKNVERMIRKYPNRIMVINWKDMLLDVVSVMQEVFHFTGLEWRTDYLKMTNLKKKFAVYGEGVIKGLERWEWSPKSKYL